MPEPINKLPKPEFVGIPGGSQFKRDKDGKEERDTTNVDKTVIYRVTRPIPNPQEAAIAAKERKNA